MAGFFQRKDAEAQRNELRFVVTAQLLDVMIFAIMDGMAEALVVLFSLRLCVFALKTAQLQELLQARNPFAEQFDRLLIDKRCGQLRHLPGAGASASEAGEQR